MVRIDTAKEYYMQRNDHGLMYICIWDGCITNMGYIELFYFFTIDVQNACIRSSFTSAHTFPVDGYARTDTYGKIDLQQEPLIYCRVFRKAHNRKFPFFCKEQNTVIACILPIIPA